MFKDAIGFALKDAIGFALKDASALDIEGIADTGTVRFTGLPFPELCQPDGPWFQVGQ